MVELLLNKGAEVDNQNNEGKTALILLCEDEADNENNYIEIVKLLLGKDAKVNAKDDNGRTALMYACKNKYKEVVELLLENGAEVNAKDNKGKTAFIYACIYQDVSVLELFTSKYITDVDESEILERQANALMYSIFYNKIKSVEFLIKKKAKLNKLIYPPNEDKIIIEEIECMTPIVYAYYNYHNYEYNYKYKTQIKKIKSHYSETPKEIYNLLNIQTNQTKYVKEHFNKLIVMLDIAIEVIPTINQNDEHLFDYFKKVSEIKENKENKGTPLSEVYDINKEYDGTTFLIAAVRDRKYDIVEKLINLEDSNSHKLVDVNYSIDEDTALIFAAYPLHLQ